MCQALVFQYLVRVPEFSFPGFSVPGFSVLGFSVPELRPQGLGFGLNVGKDQGNGGAAAPQGFNAGKKRGGGGEGGTAAPQGSNAGKERGVWGGGAAPQGFSA